MIDNRDFAAFRTHCRLIANHNEISRKLSWSNISKEQGSDNE